MMKKGVHTTRGIVCVLLGGVSWGLAGACSQYLFTYKGIDSNWLAVVRMLSAGAILVVITLLTKREEWKGLLSNKRDRWILLLFGVVGLMVSQYTYLTAVQYSNSGTATVLQNIGPALIVIVTCLMMRRFPNPVEALAIVLTLTGVFLLSTHGDFSALAISPQGLLWGLLSAVGCMLYTMIPEDLMHRWGSLPVTGMGMLIGGIVLFFVVRFWRCTAVIDVQVIQWTAIVVVLGTVISFSLFLQGVSDIGPVRASIIGCIEPVTAMVCSTVWLHTAFTGTDLLGFAAILFAVCALSVYKRPGKASADGQIQGSEKPLKNGRKQWEN